MNDHSFGAYLRSLRKNQTPPMTQEQLANAINRSKMTVSQFEKGKNAPPQGELLEKIISALSLTPEQENKLRFLSSETRKTIPGDIESYFFENPSICKAIRAAQASSADDSFWNDLSERIGKPDE
ncbi:XRE family transcriptional regulator [Butyricicoccus sp. AM05-1]|uniref:helix-turn-helix domain-containing protein n=1 Tax=Butyricicoccus sp. AM05-1 TaxID=2292004 RepID=UPI000E475885|nr:helix-turn-helix transcriptional regulator [Butyricicoccus sp. AM05-1]RHO64025.1 XRE family transcriptional regulator [Butyricicoccus sp. AM05-1]